MKETPTTIVTPRVIYQAAVIQGMEARENPLARDPEKMTAQAEKIADLMCERDRARHIWER